MVYKFDPSPGERLQLALIRWNEALGNYKAPSKNPPYATASGGYQFIDRTWKMACDKTGVVWDAKRPHAFQYSIEEQDICALWLLRTYGANSSTAWKASGPYPNLSACSYAAMMVEVATPAPKAPGQSVAPLCMDCPSPINCRVSRICQQKCKPQ